VTVILIVITIVFYELLIDCDQNQLYIHFGPVGKKITLTEIAAIRSTSIHALRDFMGWGIRVGPDGTIGYIVSGDVGVRISLKNGKKYVVTSNDPQTLVDYVRKYRK
jgi:hypothetical protein